MGVGGVGDVALDVVDGLIGGKLGGAGVGAAGYAIDLPWPSGVLGRGRISARLLPTMPVKPTIRPTCRGLGWDSSSTSSFFCGKEKNVMVR